MATALADEDRPADVREALDTVHGITDAIERVEEHTRDKHTNYFDSVDRRARGIAETIERTNRVTDAQRTALDNMLEGVRKWIHED